MVRVFVEETVLLRISLQTCVAQVLVMITNEYT